MSTLEKTFTFLWVHVVKGSTDLEQEFKFHTSRNWRFDFAHVPSRTAIEIEGAVGIRRTKSGKVFSGRHTSEVGFNNDCEKYNEATRLGWKVFRLTGEMVNSRELERLDAFIKQQPILN